MISGANNFFEENSTTEWFLDFKKIPRVCIERSDISTYTKSSEVRMKTNIEFPNAESQEKLAGFTKECSVRLVRDDLYALKMLLVKDLHNLKCEICAKIYTCRKKLKKHKESKHLLVQDKTSREAKRVSFSDNVIIHEIKEYHRCRKCSKIFPQYSTLKVHMRHEHKKRKCYICYYCLKKFVDRMFFKVHIKLHCDVCGQLLKTKNKLMEHKHSVCKVFQEYKCQICKDKYFSYIALQDHMYSHGTALICNICKEQFKTKCKLAYHIKSSHSQSLPDLYTLNLGIYRCNFCNESTYEQDIIEKHVLHLTELNKSLCLRQFTCDHCKANFLSKSELLIHKWTHYLNVTSKATSQEIRNKIKYKIGDPLPDYFKPQVIINRVQINEKVTEEPLDYIEIPHSIDGKLKKPLIDPKSKRTLISNYQCEFCTKYFSNNYGLKRHIARVHKQTDDLKCTTCEEVFAWPSLLSTHNCIRNNIPEPEFNDARQEIQLNESDGFVDFPPPIVELTVYDECVIVPVKSCDRPSYEIVLQEVPIEF